MREIQTEIRRDRIENDNRKNELQNKGQGGIKTANTHKGEATENTAAENTVAEKHNANSAAEKSQYTRTWDELKPPTSDDFTNLPPSVQNVVDSFKELSEKEASMSKGLEIKGLEDIEKGTVVGITQGVSEKTGQKTIQNQIRHDDIKNSVNRDIIKSKAVSGIKCQKVKAKVANAVKAASAIGAITSELLQGAVSSEGDGLGSESASEVKKAALEISSKSLYAVKRISEKKISDFKSSHNPFMERIADKLNAKIKEVRGKVAEKITNSKAAEKVRIIKKRIHTEKVKAVKRISNTRIVKKVKEIKKKAVSAAKNVKDKVKKVKKKTIRNITKIKHRVLKAVSIRRLFDKSGALSAKNVKRLRNNITRAKSRKVNRKKKLNKAVAKVKAKISTFAQKMKSHNTTAKKAFHKSKGAIINGTAGTIGAVSKIKEISNSNDVGNDLGNLSKDIAAKSAELSGKTVKTAIEKPLKTVKSRIKKAEARTVKTSVKKVRKARRTIKKVKKAEKTAQMTSKAAAKASKTAAKASEKVVLSIAKAIGSLMSTPAGPIILAVVCGIVLIVVVFNLISGAIQAPISLVSGVASSLSWLFGGDDGSDSYNQEIADLYSSFETKALAAMGDARTHYKDKISEISFGERDTLEFNEALYYPASSADEAVGDYFDSLNYDDYPYLMEMCYIKKLRDERAAQGLSDVDIPEVTLKKEDILNFLIGYCYEFEITIIEGQTCPTADCREREITVWCYDDADCPDVIEEGDTCPGHTETETYCDNSHIKAVVTIKPIPKNILEDDILVLTEDERNMLETALDVLREELS